MAISTNVNPRSDAGMSMIRIVVLQTCSGLLATIERPRGQAFDVVSGTIPRSRGTVGLDQTALAVGKTTRTDTGTIAQIRNVPLSDCGASATSFRRFKKEGPQLRGPVAPITCSSDVLANLLRRRAVSDGDRVDKR
jgi:hypothetical protein